VSQVSDPPLPRPPIIARTATFFTPIPEQVYEKNAHAWHQYIHSSFPKEQSEARWKFELDGYEKGVPKLRDTSPSMWIDHWHLKIHPEHGGEDTVRIFQSEGRAKGGISFNITRTSPHKPRSYGHLRASCSDNLSSAVDIFQSSGISSVHLYYQNIISLRMFPEFEMGSGSIGLGKVLKAHEQFRMPGAGFCLPYSHQMNFRASEEELMFASVEVNGHGSERPDRSDRLGDLELTVDFTVESYPSDSNKPFSPSQALQQLDLCHDKILEYFVATFTEHAKQLFGSSSKPLPTAPPANGS